MKNIFSHKHRYRVREEKKGNGKSTFYPQQRYRLFFWKDIVNVHDEPRSYATLGAANSYLYDRYKTELSKKIVGEEVHEFNAVFHKLSSSNDNEDEEVFDYDNSGSGSTGIY